MDLITHFLVILQINDIVCAFVYYLTKYTYFVSCKSTTKAQDIAQLFIATVLAHHGMPKYLLPDCDPRFVSSFWHALIAALGCEQ